MRAIKEYLEVGKSKYEKTNQIKGRMGLLSLLPILTNRTGLITSTNSI